MITIVFFDNFPNQSTCVVHIVSPNAAKIQHVVDDNKISHVKCITLESDTKKPKTLFLDEEINDFFAQQNIKLY